MKATTPYELKETRSILALGQLIGAPENRTKECMKLFCERIELNQQKLSSDFITTGVWKVGKTKEIKQQKNHTDTSIDTLEISEEDLPIEFIEQSKEKRRLERQRYLLFEILSENNLVVEKKIVEDMIWKEIGNLYGSVGSSRIGFYFSYFDAEKQIGIVRCTNHSLQAVRVVFSIITEINNNKTLFHIMKVSGTIQSLVKITKAKAS